MRLTFDKGVNWSGVIEPAGASNVKIQVGPSLHGLGYFQVPIAMFTITPLARFFGICSQVEKACRVGCPELALLTCLADDETGAESLGGREQVGGGRPSMPRSSRATLGRETPARSTSSVWDQPRARLARRIA